MRRFAAALPLAALVCLAVTGRTASPAHARPDETRTEVRLFTPFILSASLAGVQRGLTVTDRVSGTCWTGSLADGGRPDAWRCMSGNRIYDPCFQGFERIADAQTNQLVVACAPSPWAGTVVVLTPDEPLPAGERTPPAPLEGMPWALELANGVRCVFATGATAVIAGLRLNYSCPDGAWVIGDVDRSADAWQVFYMPFDDYVTRQVSVTVAWY